MASMNNEKYVSILIPLFNGIEFLKESLNSIFKQTYQNWEVLIGINSLPPAPQSIVYNIALKYKSEKVKVIIYDSKGKSNTLNKMILDCQYDIICLLDVDDKWHPEKLKEQIIIKDKYDVVATWCKYFDNNDIIPPLPKEDIHPLTFLRVNPIVNSSCMLNKKDCFWKEDYILEDYDLWLRLNYEGKKFYNIPRILTYHRIHEQSFYNNKNNDHVEDLIKKWSKVYFDSPKFCEYLKVKY